ncbi:MAG: GNAT family N-acetyltransferase [Methylocystis sp.]|nr:GNAT family N-acetyltransferase [Methylocystis sp.]
MVTNLETPHDAPRDAVEAGATTKLAPASVSVFSRFEDARDDWLELFALAPASAYQGYDFTRAWFETLGKDQKLEPMLVVARDANQRPLALLPLAQAQWGPLRIALFLCGKESNFNLALVRPGAVFDDAAIRRLLTEAANAAPRRPDLFYFRNQPRRWEHTANPLVLLSWRPSPSFAYGAVLPFETKDLDARLSNARRKKLRWKAARLAKLGAVAFEHRAEGARAVEIVDALLAQKGARLRAEHIDASFATPARRDFLQRLCAGAAASGALETHALTLDGKIIAAYAGLAHRGRFSAMLNSFDMHEDVVPSSPGELLVHALLRDLVTRGFTHFDLGVGEALYKATICEETIELCDTIVPATPQGALAAPLLAALLAAKRKIKQTPWIGTALAAVRFGLSVRRRGQGSRRAQTGR